MELWQVYGSKSEYLKAPRSEALKVRLILSKKHEIENEQAKAEQRAREEEQARLDELLGNVSS